MQNIAWEEFKRGAWTEEIDVQDFIQKNYTPYAEDESFLKPASQRTLQLWEEVKVFLWEEHQHQGVYSIDTHTVSSITSHQPGYINRDLEVIVGLQTDEPLKRAIMPNGGIRMVRSAVDAYGYELDPEIEMIFTHYRKTHNQGVFDAYTQEIRNARKAGIITGLPDSYGRGRIIGDYRRIALYGTAFLIRDKYQILAGLDCDHFSEDLIRQREELTEQISALKELETMTELYGYDISRPARNAREAIGGMGIDGCTLVTRTSFRFLHTLHNLGPAPEPNLTVLWSQNLPPAFKEFCTRTSIASSSIQYENDDLMRPYWGDDYGIACCVSAMRMGKQMQFFGARANLAKALLYAINGGIDELLGMQVAPNLKPITAYTLDYDELWQRYDQVLDWLAKTYVNTMHGRDHRGALASMNSVAKLPYRHALDGISYTFSIVPGGLGREEKERPHKLSALLDGYFAIGGHHINVNVLERETLVDAMQHPEKYPQLTIRVSGYAVNFIKLSREQLGIHSDLIDSPSPEPREIETSRRILAQLLPYLNIKPASPHKFS